MGRNINHQSHTTFRNGKARPKTNDIIISKRLEICKEEQIIEKYLEMRKNQEEVKMEEPDSKNIQMQLS